MPGLALEAFRLYQRSGWYPTMGLLSEVVSECMDHSVGPGS